MATPRSAILIIIAKLIVCLLGSHDSFHERSTARTCWLQVSFISKGLKACPVNDGDGGGGGAFYSKINHSCTQVLLLYSCNFI